MARVTITSTKAVIAHLRQKMMEAQMKYGVDVARRRPVDRETSKQIDHSFGVPNTTRNVAIAG